MIRIIQSKMADFEPGCRVLWRSAKRRLRGGAVVVGERAGSVTSVGNKVVTVAFDDGSTGVFDSDWFRIQSEAGKVGIEVTERPLPAPPGGGDE